MPEKTKRPPVSDAGADATELTTAAPIAYRSVSGGMRLLRLTEPGQCHRFIALTSAAR